MRIRANNINRDPDSVHEKSWGYEIWIENCNEYCGKKLCIRTGEYSSLHFHIDKLETMYLQSGEMIIELIDPVNATPYSITMAPGDWVKIPRGQAHRLIAKSDVELIEFSTMHNDADSYRVSPSSGGNK